MELIGGQLGPFCATRPRGAEEVTVAAGRLALRMTCHTWNLDSCRLEAGLRVCELPSQASNLSRGFGDERGTWVKFLCRVHSTTPHHRAGRRRGLCRLRQHLDYSSWGSVRRKPAFLTFDL
ncbi:unnamed protein product, partial [Ectocarpus sp. 13 AM-2016]